MDSFQSFVDYSGFKESPPGDPEVDLRLLPNEIVSSQCNDCFFYSQFCESLVGRVYCTNSRLAFVPALGLKSFQSLPIRSIIFDDFFDIPLVSIHKIYYSVSDNTTGMDLSLIERRKFKHLTSSVSSMEIVSSLKLFLKDFRVITLDLSRSQNAANLANHVFHFSRPSGPQHIVQCSSPKKLKGEILFNRSSDWEAELLRCGWDTSKHWRILFMNKDGIHHSVLSYPMHVVVPAELFKHDLDKMIPNWKMGRFPIWVWSYSFNSTSLLRSACYENNQPAIDLNKRFCGLVSRSHPPNDLPFEYLITEDMTTFKLANSYEKLRKMCSFDSYLHLDSFDHEWLVRLHESQWPRLVSGCLRSATEIIEWMADRQRSVVIYEDEGRDFSAVISAIVQVSMDPFYRTQNGLTSLIAKEFTALGHPFGDRSLGMADDQTTPTLLIFLDCIHQMIMLYPTQFSYSLHFLIALWDLSLTGIVPGFTCNSVSDQLAFGITGGPSCLSQYFTQEYAHLFRNLEYEACRTVAELKPPSLLLCKIIRPPTLLADFRFFSECYLRWMPPSNIKNGGDLSLYRQLDLIMNNLVSGERMAKNELVNNEEVEDFSSAHPYSSPEKVHFNCLNRAIQDNSDALSLSQLSISGRQRAESQFGIPSYDSQSLRSKFSFKAVKKKSSPREMSP